MTKGDKYLIVILLVISLTSLFFTRRTVLAYDEKYISLQVNGEEIKKIFFSKEVQGKKIPIKTEFGYNLLEIGEEKVRIKDADCPDKLDVKKGWIEDVGQSIICLPNRLVVEIKASSKNQEVDYISN